MDPTQDGGASLQHICRILLQILVCIHLDSFRTGHFQKAQLCIEIVLTVRKATANVPSSAMQTFIICFVEDSQDND